MLKNPLSTRSFGTFWYGGRLTALEQACAHSFLQHGYRLVLFSYEPIQNAPDGVELRDAAELVPEKMTKRFFLNGKPILQPFSNLFRYIMIRDLHLVWTDLDVLMINRLPDDTPEDIVVREEQGGLNNALLYIKSKEVTARLIDGASHAAGRNLVWGETGPILLTRVIEEAGESVSISEHSIFYPIEHYDVFKIFLEEFTRECDNKCRSAATVHLFNNVLTKMGYWKDILPPPGSFLHEKLKENESLSFFRDVYPKAVMSQVTENYRMRLSGEGLGIKGVINQLVPSIRRTWRHYHPDRNKHLPS